MDSFQSLNYEEKLLLAQLPELPWRLVFRKLGVDFAALEACSEATNVFRTIILGNGHVSLGFEKILPNAFREWIDRSDRMDDSQSEPMLLLLTLVKLKPMITAFEIIVDRNFRPENHVLNSFLKLQNDNLEIFHISCLGIESNPVLLDIKEKTMKNVRDLKIIRSTIVSIKRRFYWKYQKSLYVDFSESTSVPPALEKLTLSLEWFDDWPDLFKIGRRELAPFSRYRPSTVRHLRFIDFTTADGTVRCKEKFKDAVGDAYSAFSNLVSLEIPAFELQRMYIFADVYGTLKCIILTLPRWNRHRHVFDMCITGYGKEVCAALFADPTRDPMQVREEIEEENCRQIPTDVQLSWNSWRVRNDINYRRLGHRAPSLARFSLSLEELRIQSETGEFGPTIVSCVEFLNMRCLKILDFGGNKPVHIPDEMIQKMRKRFTVLCD